MRWYVQARWRLLVAAALLPGLQAAEAGSNGGSIPHYDMATADMDSFGFSSELPPSQPPVCVADSSTDFHQRVIFLTFAGQPDRYSAIAPQLRETINRVNGIIRRDAAEFGVVADFKVHCTDGAVTIEKVVMPQTVLAEGNTGIDDLGFRDLNTKYWIFSDGKDPVNPCSCSGHATIDVDDRPTIDNKNNVGPDYATTYLDGPSEPFRNSDVLVMVALHEAGHTLGAVQPSAPNIGPGFHCTDGGVMCFGYSGIVCRVFLAFDCNNDDYFHPRPDQGTYLDSRWNIAAPVNRFLRIVPGEPPTQPQNLSVVQTDEEGQLTLEWDSPAFSGSEPLAGYHVHRGRAPEDVERIIDVGANEIFVDEDLSPLETYYYRVTAYTELAEGPFSLETSGFPFSRACRENICLEVRPISKVADAVWPITDDWAETLLVDVETWQIELRLTPGGSASSADRVVTLGGQPRPEDLDLELGPVQVRASYFGESCLGAGVCGIGLESSSTEPERKIGEVWNAEIRLSSPVGSVGSQQLVFRWSQPLERALTNNIT